jgi:nuclear pore complex protein Nup155
MNALDQASSQTPDIVNGRLTVSAKRRREAFDVVDTSEDEVFQTDLYDWYLAEGRTDRLLGIQSPYIVTYLQRKSADDIVHADLLWKYYCQADRNSDAAAVQLALAKSPFELPLDRRIEYLSRAKANANTYTAGVSRPTRQVLLREVSDLLDVANIQDDLLQRLKADERIAPERRPDVIRDLDGPILSLSDVSNPSPAWPNTA